MKDFLFEEILEVEIISKEVKAAGLSTTESDYLLTKIRSAVHHEVTDFILSELPEPQKEEFIILLASGDNRSVLSKLQALIPDIENKMRSKIADIERQLMAKLV